MQNAGLYESQAGIKIVRKNINNLRYVDVTILREQNEEELKRASWRRWKEESKKAGLKLSINKTKIVVSGPITS